MSKIRPNKVQNTPKIVSNREIKSLENIINTSKVVIEKPEIDTKPKIATELKIVNKNYDEYKNRVIKQLKKTLKKVI